MGSMYWQLNDLWQAPTWSTIEYHKQGGKWKLAHYYVKNAYASLVLSPILNKSKIDIYALSDLAKTVRSTFSVSIYSFDSLVPLSNLSYEFWIAPFRSDRVLSIDTVDIEKSTGCQLNSFNSCLLVIDSADRTLFSAETSINFWLFNNKLANVTNLAVATLTIDSIVFVSVGLFSIELRTNKIALFVWLDLNTTSFFGIFSDNGFHMVTQTRIVTFQTDCTNIGEDDLKKYLTVQTLANSY